jgi:hypothetical protein
MKQSQEYYIPMSNPNPSSSQKLLSIPSIGDINPLSGENVS